MKNYRITYLGHSAFVIEVANYYLFFDYVGISKEGHYDVEDIDFENYQDKKIIMFHSHDHFDHYNYDLHVQTQKYSNVITVLGDISSDLKNTITIKPREVKALDEIKIYAGDSTDLGVCYLLVLDGLVIYYGGDNADWGSGYEENYTHYQEIDYFQSLGYHVDLAFIPVCNFFSQRFDDITKGAIYSIRKLDPDVVIPMHAAGKEYVYKEFEKDAIDQHISNKIVCMEKVGQIYE